MAFHKHHPVDPTPIPGYLEARQTFLTTARSREYFPLVGWGVIEHCPKEYLHSPLVKHGATRKLRPLPLTCRGVGEKNEGKPRKHLGTLTYSIILKMVRACATPYFCPLCNAIILDLWAENRDIIFNYGTRVRKAENQRVVKGACGGFSRTIRINPRTFGLKN